jgi:hypothetical protein
MIETPTPEPVVATPKQSSSSRQTPEEIIRESLEMIESGYDSEYEWDLVRGLYNRLMSKKKLSNREIELLCMMDPILMRYGQLDHRGVNLNPARMSELRAQLQASKALSSSTSSSNSDNSKKRSE